jgi:hypothetical protein
VLVGLAQLKHCTRQVSDILIALIKHLSLGPVQYLLSLCQSASLHDMTPQTVKLICALQKCVWGAATSLHHTPPATQHYIVDTGKPPQSLT